MNEKKFEQMLKKGESEKVEFKKSTAQIERALRSICGFLNHKGGSVYFGISDKNELIGQSATDSTLKSLSQKIRQKIKPEISPEIKVLEIKGRKVIEARIKKGANKPYYLDGISYKRVSTESPPIAPEELESIILKKNKIQWDSQICEEASLEDINWVIVKEFFIPKYESLAKRRLAGTGKELLEALGCIKNNKPTNAGILLFGKNPEMFFRNSYIAMARYRGTVESTERLDYKEFTGNIFQQIDNSDKYIKEHVAILSRLHPMNVEREDISEYPFFSIRELIINAVCHRDYSEKGSKIIIKIFNERINYYNPGGLPKGVTPENILKMQKSRNPVIANILSKVKYIEELGEGWNKIINEFKTHPLRPEMPKVEDLKIATSVTIYKAVLNIFERFKNILNERQIKLIKHLQMHEYINSTEYAKIFGVTNRQAREDLSKMASLRLLIKEGKARLTKYKIYPEISGNIRKYDSDKSYSSAYKGDIRGHKGIL